MVSRIQKSFGCCDLAVAIPQRGDLTGMMIGRGSYPKIPSGYVNSVVNDRKTIGKP
jgi:ATP phosphoribosyltransferase